MTDCVESKKRKLEAPFVQHIRIFDNFFDTMNGSGEFIAEMKGLHFKGASILTWCLDNQVPTDKIVELFRFLETEYLEEQRQMILSENITTSLRKENLIPESKVEKATEETVKKVVKSLFSSAPDFGPIPEEYKYQRVNFGKYKGDSLHYVLSTDCGYVIWACKHPKWNFFYKEEGREAALHKYLRIPYPYVEEVKPLTSVNDDCIDGCC